MEGYGGGVLWDSCSQRALHPSNTQQWGWVVVRRLVVLFARGPPTPVMGLDGGSHIGPQPELSCTTTPGPRAMPLRHTPPSSSRRCWPGSARGWHRPRPPPSPCWWPSCWRWCWCWSSAFGVGSAAENRSTWTSFGWIRWRTPGSLLRCTCPSSPAPPGPDSIRPCSRASARGADGAGASAAARAWGTEGGGGRAQARTEWRAFTDL